MSDAINGQGQVFWAPAGTEVPADGNLEQAGFKALGVTESFVLVDETRDALIDLGDAFTQLSEAAWSVSFTLDPANNRALRKLFFPRPPKRIRKALVARRRQIAKWRRDVHRETQRRAIGILTNSRSEKSR